MWVLEYGIRGDSVIIRNCFFLGRFCRVREGSEWVMRKDGWRRREWIKSFWEFEKFVNRKWIFVRIIGEG